ncbi:MAG: dihydroorotate dehydrogenase [Oscillospiraceae bacterium]|nr:dihydroorotate dehydrogenase [Oscillospiraceae bacterium]
MSMRNRRKKRDLSVTVAGVTFPNPIIAASGTYGFGEDYNELYPINILGGISCKGLTLEPREGNPPPRIAETPSGMLNSVGLQNPGIDVFLQKHLPFMNEACKAPIGKNRPDTVVIANFAGATLDDYVKTAERLDKSDISMLELNISCPNVKEGGAAWGVSTESAARVTKSVRAVTKKPLMVKLTPNVSDVCEIARAVESEGADAVSLINTLLGMRIDIRTHRPILRNNVGGLSGASVFPVALRMVWQVANAVKIDVVGMGGVMTSDDAVEMMLAGAKAVQIGTVIISDPYSPLKIIGGIEHYMNTHNIKDLGSEIVGKVRQW